MAREEILGSDTPGGPDGPNNGRQKINRMTTEMYAFRGLFAGGTVGQTIVKTGAGDFALGWGAGTGGGSGTPDDGSVTLAKAAAGIFFGLIVANAGARPATALVGQLIYQVDNGTLYKNDGTFSTPVWNNVAGGESGAILEHSDADSTITPNFKDVLYRGTRPLLEQVVQNFESASLLPFTISFSDQTWTRTTDDFYSGAYSWKPPDDSSGAGTTYLAFVPPEGATDASVSVRYKVTAGDLLLRPDTFSIEGDYMVSGGGSSGGWQVVSGDFPTGDPDPTLYLYLSYANTGPGTGVAYVDDITISYYLPDPAWIPYAQKIGDHGDVSPTMAPVAGDALVRGFYMASFEEREDFEDTDYTWYMEFGGSHPWSRQTTVFDQGTAALGSSTDPGSGLSSHFITVMPGYGAINVTVSLRYRVDHTGDDFYTFDAFFGAGGVGGEVPPLIALEDEVPPDGWGVWSTASVTFDLDEDYDQFDVLWQFRNNGSDTKRAYIDEVVITWDAPVAAWVADQMPVYERSVRPLSADPGGPADGDQWARSDLTPPQLRARKGTKKYKATLTEYEVDATLVTATDATPLFDAPNTYIGQQFTPATTGLSIRGLTLGTLVGNGWTDLYLITGALQVAHATIDADDGDTVYFDSAVPLTNGTTYEIGVGKPGLATPVGGYYANSNFGSSNSQITIGSGAIGSHSSGWPYTDHTVNASWRANFTLLYNSPTLGSDNQRRLITLASDVTNNNASANTFQDVTGLSFPVVSGQVYAFEVVIPYTVNATTTGSRWSLNGPSLTRGAWTVEMPPTAGPAPYVPTLSRQTAYNTGTVTTDTPATDSNMVIIKGFVQPSASGTVVVRFASEVASAAVVAKAGARLEVF